MSSVGHLSRLHRTTRDHVSRIATSHPSIICRAVATSITSHHLDKFHRKILDVESRILKQDASAVGAYNIVPLAGVVSEFSEWVRTMEWLCEIANFMSPLDASSNHGQLEQKDASGAELLDKLRTEVQTGYPDIEDTARHLGKVAETSWLRQLSTWLLYGRIPSFGATDFFVQQEGDADERVFVLRNKLIPKFVTRQTASSILFIGKSLNQIQSLPSSAKSRGIPGNSSEPNLLPKHVNELSQVSTPISAAKLSEAVGNIRLSLSRNLLQYLLPRDKIVEILTVLYQFFLLGRGEFAIILIAEADDRIASRHRQPSASTSVPPVKGIILKEAEINQILARSLSILSALSTQDDNTDDILDVATKLLHLTNHSSSNHRPGTPGRARDVGNTTVQLPSLSFNELLLASPTLLTMDVQTPLDLFMSKADIDVYSSINSYLLAIRRAHLHLAQLWRHSSIRRDHPCPPGYQFSNSAHGKAILNQRRQRTAARARDMRKVWATCAAAIFFFAESEAYFQGVVVQQSFKHFISWVTRSQHTLPRESHLASSTLPDSPTSPGVPSEGGIHYQHDPEALALAHQRFLSFIIYALLLTDHAYTKTLRTLCTHVDELVALVSRLTRVQQSLDLEEDEGVEDYAQNNKKEESEVILELDRARRRLDSDLKALVERLREIDGERISTSIPGLLNGVNEEEGAFEPLRIGGVDRLLMKLDWGGESEDDNHEDLL